MTMHATGTCASQAQQIEHGVCLGFLKTFFFLNSRKKFKQKKTRKNLGKYNFEIHPFSFDFYESKMN